MDWCCALLKQGLALSQRYKVVCAVVCLLCPSTHTEPPQLPGGVRWRVSAGLVDYPPDGIKPPSPFIPLSWRQLILDVLHSIQPTELNQPLLLASRAYRNRRRARWSQGERTRLSKILLTPPTPSSSDGWKRHKFNSLSSILAIPSQIWRVRKLLITSFVHSSFFNPSITTVMGSSLKLHLIVF